MRKERNLKMNDSDVSKQIQQMVRFIRQEAEEKANEISVSAEEVYFSPVPLLIFYKIILYDQYQSVFLILLIEYIGNWNYPYVKQCFKKAILGLASGLTPGRGYDKTF